LFERSSGSGFVINYEDTKAHIALPFVLISQVVMRSAAHLVIGSGPSRYPKERHNQPAARPAQSIAVKPA
jgi:hypothetical protein